MTPGPARRPARTALATLAVCALLVAVAACAPTQVSHGHGSSGGSKTGTTSTTQPSASSTPSALPLPAPAVRITKSCNNLVSASALTASLGAPAAYVTPPAYFDDDVIYQQDGALRCNWSDNYPKDAQQASNHLVLRIMPDIPTATWTSVAKFLVQSGETSTTLIGGKAYGWCNPATPKGTVCNIDSLVGSTWIDIEVESLPKTFATSSAGLSHFAALLNPIVTAAGASGFVTEPRWKDPTATPIPATCATLLPTAKITAASGATGIQGIGPDIFDQESLTAYPGSGDLLGRVECDLASGDQKDGFFAYVLPGGAWAWPQMVAADSGQPGYAAVPSLGSQAIQFTNSDANQATFYWVRGHNLLRLDVSLPTASKNSAVALVLATGINNEIPG